MDELLSKNNSETQDYCECNKCEGEQLKDKYEDTKKNVDKVTRVESYLKEKRILELIYFMLTKVVAEAPKKPVLYLEKLLDDCIGFLAYRSTAPTVYETRHFEAMLKSFDPCQKGWLNSSQVRHLYESCGLEISQSDREDNLTVDHVLEDIKNKQALALRELLLAGSNKSISNK